MSDLDSELGIKRIRYTAAVRRRLIVEAAFAAIAAQGFENLRTRDIADQVGINSATLHHHFPTKDDLIAGIAEMLEARFIADKTRTVTPGAASAVELLQCQFVDAAHYRDQQSDLIAVFREFIARGPRDPMIAGLVARLGEIWRLDIADIVERGIGDGSFRPDLDPRAASDCILGAIWGAMTFHASSPEAYDRMCGEILKMVGAVEHSARQ